MNCFRRNKSSKYDPSSDDTDWTGSGSTGIEVLPEARCPSIITRCPGLTGWRGRSNGLRRGGSTATIMTETPKVRVTGNDLLNFGKILLSPARKKFREGNIFRSCLSVCLSFCPPGSWGLHVTIMYDALDLTVQPPAPAQPLQTYMRPHCTGTLRPNPIPFGHGTSLYRDPQTQPQPHLDMGPQPCIPTPQ